MRPGNASFSRCRRLQAAAAPPSCGVVRPWPRKLKASVSSGFSLDVPDAPRKGSVSLVSRYADGCSLRQKLSAPAKTSFPQRFWWRAAEVQASPHAQHGQRGSIRRVGAVRRLQPGGRRTARRIQRNPRLNGKAEGENGSRPRSGRIVIHTTSESRNRPFWRNSVTRPVVVLTIHPGDRHGVQELQKKDAVEQPGRPGELAGGCDVSDQHRHGARECADKSKRQAYRRQPSLQLG